MNCLQELNLYSSHAGKWRVFADWKKMSVGKIKEKNGKQSTIPTNYGGAAVIIIPFGTLGLLRIFCESRDRASLLVLPPSISKQVDVK